MSKIHNYTKELLQETMNNCYEFNSVLKVLNIPVTSSHLRTLNRKIRKYDIDLTKFLLNKKLSKQKPIRKCFTCEEVLIKYQEKFCSSSCAAIYNNSIRSKESREKQRKSIISTIKNMPEPEFKNKFKTTDDEINFIRLNLDKTTILENAKICRNMAELLRSLNLKTNQTNRRILGVFLNKEGIKFKPKIVKFKTPETKYCIICYNEHVKNGLCCSKTCAAINRHLKDKNDGIEPNIINYNRIYNKPKKLNCKICSKPSGKRVTCSDECLKINSKLQGTRLVRKRIATGENFLFRRKSKLEQKFEDFLVSKNVRFRNEVYAKSPYNLYGYYRLDFVIKNKKLIIEVDGKHHEKPAQRKHDILRDYAMVERGWKVLRVNYYEVNKPAILEMIYNQFLE